MVDEQQVILAAKHFLCCELSILSVSMLDRRGRNMMYIELFYVKRW
jgi:hypothetical protein